jgi:hypothetical protein
MSFKSLQTHFNGVLFVLRVDPVLSVLYKSMMTMRHLKQSMDIYHKAIIFIAIYVI